MTDRDKLAQMHACDDALDWIGERTIEQAWRDCERGEWMCWLLKRIAPGDPRLRLAAADMAERVWNLIPDEPTRLAAAWAIGAARRGNEDEMRTASATAYEAAAATAYAAYYATSAAAAAASDNATSAADNAACDEFATYAAESAAQADILREYYSAREIDKLFRQAPIGGTP